MKAILTVVGKDHTGIVAKVSSQLAKDEINILDISQTIMDTNFVMMMSVGLPENINFKKVSQEQNKFTKQAKCSLAKILISEPLRWEFRF